MANTVQQTTLSVQINESISINGVDYGNNISKTIQGCGKVDQRVMEMNSSAMTQVFAYQASLPDLKGTGVKSEFKYFRITNLDDSVGITVQIYVTAAKTGYFKLSAGTSLVLFENDVDFLCEGDSFSLADITAVAVKTDQAGEEVVTSYIEYMAVFAGGVGVGEGGE